MKIADSDTSPLGLTVEYPPGNTAVDRMPLAVPADSGVAALEDLRSLLHRRLRFLCLLLALLYGSAVVFLLYHLPELLEDTPGLHISLWIVILSSIILTALSALVWRRHLLSLGQLRSIELVLVALLAIRIVSRGLVAFWHPVTQRLAEISDAEGLLWAHLIDASNYMCYLAAIFIIAYGICIPNTWRRCVVVVTALWSIAPTMFVIGLIDNDMVGAVQFSPDQMNPFLLLTTAAALAVYGSHRIETLRHAEVQARRLGQSVLKERLGGGGMGEVYRANHLLLRRPCAIKLIRPECAGDADMLQRFEREVQTTATLTHPNTVQIFDYGHTREGTFYYVMEYLPGLTLEELVLQHGPLPPGRVVHLLLQVCGALHEAHAVGLIHRDIKPGNVMICERGRTHDVVKLLDFGLVHTHFSHEEDDRLTQQGIVIGTPAFLSPEQAGGSDTVDARSDIYSLGALAYFLLTGQAVFAGRSPIKMLAAHLYESPTPLTTHRPDVPIELEAVILHCLAKDPEHRFSHIQCLAAALQSCELKNIWTEDDASQWWQSNH